MRFRALTGHIAPFFSNYPPFRNSHEGNAGMFGFFPFRGPFWPYTSCARPMCFEKYRSIKRSDLKAGGQLTIMHMVLDKDKKMPVYMIIELEVTDPELYAEYVEKVPPVIEKFGGRYLVRGGKVTPITDDWSPERIIVIEFPSFEHIKNWLISPEHAPLAEIRQRSTIAKAIIVEGYAGESASDSPDKTPDPEAL